MWDYGYAVQDDEGSRLMTMETRHDAIGIAVLLDRVSDRTHTIEPVKKTGQNEFRTLVPIEERGT